jgi:HSP20 family protein
MKIMKYESPLAPLEVALDRFNWGFPMLDRIFGEVDGDQGWSTVRLPKTNVHETDEAYVFTMEMPGLTKENVEVNFEGDSLIVKGEKSQKQEEKGVIRREYHSTRFERTFNVGPGIDREKVKAKMEDGLLTVTLPKTRERIGRKIEIA